MNNPTPTTQTETNPTAIFMMGGPGAGKSYIRNREFPTLHVVDCDSFKEAHPDYDPKNPAALHEWSRTQCVKAFFRALGGDEDFCYDGTGTNLEKMISWIGKAKSAGFNVKLVYVRCTLPTALDRNANRERVVPEHIVRDKHEVVEETFQVLRRYADEVVTYDND